uniref:Uncharacterized protein n=1 Tax=Arion vulgaris TaxID=1028688 RepID=A0A0B7A882_9EUPU
MLTLYSMFVYGAVNIYSMCVCMSCSQHILSAAYQIKLRAPYMYILVSAYVSMPQRTFKDFQNNMSDSLLPYFPQTFRLSEEHANPLEEHRNLQRNVSTT